MRYPSNPAAPGYGGGTNAPFNFMNYQPSASGAASPSSPGIGSNQYGSLPPWMNTSASTARGGTQPSSGGYMPPSGWNLQPIGPVMSPQPINIPGYSGQGPLNFTGQQQPQQSREQLLQQLQQPFQPVIPNSFNNPALIGSLNSWAQQNPQYGQQVQQPITPGQGGWSQPMWGGVQAQGNPSTTPNWWAQQAQQTQQAQNNMLNQFTGGQQNPFPQWSINNMFQQWMGGQTGQQSIPASTQMAQMQQNPMMQMLYQMMGQGGFGNMGQVNW